MVVVRNRSREEGLELRRGPAEDLVAEYWEAHVEGVGPPEVGLHAAHDFDELESIGGLDGDAEDAQSVQGIVVWGR